MPIDLQKLNTVLKSVQSSDDESAMNIELERASSILGREASIDDIENMRGEVKSYYDELIKKEKENKGKDKRGKGKKKSGESINSKWKTVESLIEAGDFERARSLLPNTGPDKMKDTIHNILYLAVTAGEIDIFGEVLGISGVEPDEETITAVIESGEESLIERFKKSGLLNLDGLGLAVAVNAGQEDVAVSMINNPDEYGINPEGGGNLALRLAAENKNEKIVNLLLGNPDVVADIVDTLDTLVEEDNKEAIAMLISNDAVMDHFANDKTQEAIDIKSRLKDSMSGTPEVNTFLKEVGGISEALDFVRFMSRFEA